MGIQVVIKRPADPVGGGHYRLGLGVVITGAVSANTPIFSMRWKNTAGEKLVQVNKFSVTNILQTAFGAAQKVDVGVYFAKAFTAADTGGTVVDVATIPGKRSSFSPLASADLEVMTGPSMAVGTRSLVAVPLSQKGCWMAAIGNGLSYDDDPVWDQGGEGPVILQGNEGLVMNVITAFGATGVVLFYVRVGFSVLRAENIQI